MNELFQTWVYSLPTMEQNGYLSIFYHLYTFCESCHQVQVIPTQLELKDKLQGFQIIDQIHISQDCK
jgi:hypothetical protein